MKKSFLTAIAILSTVAYADLTPDCSLTNAMSWVGVNINFSNVSNLPQRVSATPGDALLGLFRSYVSNDATDHFFHLSPATRNDFYGTSDMNCLSESMKNKYTQTTSDTNLLIRSMTATTNGPNRIVVCVDLVETLCSEVFDNDISYFDIIYTNGEWKIDNIRGISE